MGPTPVQCGTTYSISPVSLSTSGYQHAEDDEFGSGSSPIASVALARGGYPIELFAGLRQRYGSGPSIIFGHGLQKQP
jgi:hypothetical protein